MSNISEELENQIKVYPNPSTGQVQVQCSYETKERIKLEISSIDGSKIWEDNFYSNSYYQTINLSDQANGVYILKLSGNNHIETRKIIINK